MSNQSKINRKDLLLDKRTGRYSLKRDMLYQTWKATLAMVIITIAVFLITRDEKVSNAMTGIATLLGVPLTVAYAGMIYGEKNDIQEKNCVPPTVPEVPKPTDPPA